MEKVVSQESYFLPLDELSFPSARDSSSGGSFNSGNGNGGKIFISQKSDMQFYFNQKRILVLIGRIGTIFNPKRRYFSTCLLYISIMSFTYEY